MDPIHILDNAMSLTFLLNLFDRFLYKDVVNVLGFSITGMAVYGFIGVLI